MKKREIARQLARNTGITRGEAADAIDRMVNDILTKLRSGEPANVPGFGRFATNAAGQIEFKPSPARSNVGEPTQ